MSYRKPREATCRLIEMAEEDGISWEDIARAALSYMSEYDVADMCGKNELFSEEDEDSEEDDSDDEEE
jgi:hypothetical protein